MGEESSSESQPCPDSGQQGCRGELYYDAIAVSSVYVLVLICPICTCVHWLAEVSPATKLLSLSISTVLSTAQLAIGPNYTYID